MLKRFVLFLGVLTSMNLAFSATPQELLKAYEAQASKGVPTRGEQFFTNKHGKEWRCASCHDLPPTHDSKHIVTGKVIKALSPNSNPDRFSDHAKVEKWFKRNCHDVLGRECDAQEKADVLAWLMTVK
jgi:hypothetical protein